MEYDQGVSTLGSGGAGAGAGGGTAAQGGAAGGLAAGSPRVDPKHMAVVVVAAAAAETVGVSEAAHVAPTHSKEYHYYRRQKASPAHLHLQRQRLHHHHPRTQHLPGRTLDPTRIAWMSRTLVVWDASASTYDTPEL